MMFMFTVKTRDQRVSKLDNMKHPLPYLMLLLLLSLQAYPQNGAFTSANARNLALGGSGVALSGLSSLGNNPAGLAELLFWGATVQAEERFLLSELRLLSAGAAIPTASGTIGLVVHQFGFELYREQKVGLAYGRRLFDALYLGAQLNWLQTRIPAYGQRSLISFDIGLLAPVSRQLSFGFYLVNPIRQEITDGEFLATVLRFGLAYHPAPGLLLLAEVEKDIRQPVRVHTGLEYQITDPLYLRLGVATEPVSVSFGLGLMLSGALAVDVASSWHPTLGVTPAVGVRYGGG